jgi:tetratricopeptide (TPR) repeat protein
MALVNKGDRLVELERSDEATKVYDAVVERFGDAGEPMLRLRVAMALVNKGERFNELGRGDEAAAAFKEVELRFDSTDDPNLRNIAERARKMLERIA